LFETHHSMPPLSAASPSIHSVRAEAPPTKTTRSAAAAAAVASSNLLRLTQRQLTYPRPWRLNIYFLTRKTDVT
jgi:hypothetical protein